MLKPAVGSRLSVRQKQLGPAFAGPLIFLLDWAGRDCLGGEMCTSVRFKEEFRGMLLFGRL